MTKRRAKAVVVLFLYGFSLRSCARLLGVTYLEACEAIRQQGKGRR